MFKLEFDTDNAAFDDDPAAEIARILRSLAEEVPDCGGSATWNIRDNSGNTIGKATWKARTD